MSSAAVCGEATGSGWRSGDEREPSLTEGGGERHGVGSTEDVADGPLTVVEDEGELRLQREVRPRVDVGDELVVAVQAARVAARVGGPHADVVDGITIGRAVRDE